MATDLPSNFLEMQAFAAGYSSEEEDERSSVPVGLGGMLGSPSAVSSPVVPLSERAISVENDRDGGHKYLQAAQALRHAVETYETETGCDSSALFKRAGRRAEKMAHADAESFFMNLAQAVDKIKSPSSNDPKRLRKDNSLVIKYMRQAIQSTFYQQYKNSSDKGCLFLQRLCVARFTEVHPYDSFKDLVNKAVSSSKAPQTLQLLDAINLDNVGSTIRAMNHSLKSAGSDYRKSFPALCLQKITGEGDVLNDPGGSMNVPYLRSQFSVVNEGSVSRKVGFCRFGAPTVRGWWGERIVDPTLLCFLDRLQNDGGKQFLYVNHLKPTKIEGERAQTIRSVETTHPNFHFLSIPMDGTITDKIHSDLDMEKLKELIFTSYKAGNNGCQWPVGVPFVEDDFRRLLEHVHTSWFFGRDMSGLSNQSINNREAFWGIFNTVLKHYVIQKINISFMNSACKDNKDRGGTFGTIDEAVRNLLSGKHMDPNTLRQLVYSALAPYMIKLEHILDNPADPNHNRLGYLINVLNHIATLTPQEVIFIQQTHAVLTGVYGVEQKIPKGPCPVESELVASSLSEKDGLSPPSPVSSEQSSSSSASISPIGGSDVELVNLVKDDP